MTKKLFSPQEANKRLPLVRKIVEDILSKGKKLREVADNIEKKQEVPQEIIDLQVEIEKLLDELEELGCYYKDWNFEMGLVDFPAMIDQQQVFLCWRSDEKDVRWFHPINEGYAARKPIPNHLLN